MSDDSASGDEGDEIEEEQYNDNGEDYETGKRINTGVNFIDSKSQHEDKDECEMIFWSLQFVLRKVWGVWTIWNIDSWAIQGNILRIINALMEFYENFQALILLID